MTAVIIMSGLALAFALLAVLGISNTFGQSWVGHNGGGPVVSLSPVITGGLAVQIDRTAANGNALAGGATNVRVQEGFDVAAVKGVLISVSGNDGTVTIKTNDSGTPIHTFTFASGGGEVTWTNRAPSEYENPFVDQSSTDVTDFYLSNAGTADADVSIRILY